ncbi:MAG: DUF2550 domain-containing protein [Propioniciclava sp.]|uniref:DUF2550 domain-containing protein n=1 Tax=Propioniciclava sp. TaxID=2038686 RepID=UPI0039E43D76
MPEGWNWTAILVLVALVCVLTPIFWLVLRGRWLSRHGRVLQCSLRRPDSPVWTLGIARFRDDTFEWFRVFGLSVRPRYCFERAHTHVVKVRPPGADETDELYRGHYIAELGAPHEGLLLAMSRPDLTAFSSWTEAGPPGGPDSQRVGY